MNSPGAAVVTTIKSGGNAFKGLEHLSYEPGSFVGSNGEPSDIAARGYVCPPNGTGVPQCDNPNLLFWEGARRSRRADREGQGVVLRAPTTTSRSTSRSSGVAQSVATDLGIFDNYTVKGTGKVSQNNTLIGYIQRGHKQKPFRGLSTLVPAESILAQDSWSRMYKGEWQSVLSNRAFLTSTSAASRWTGRWCRRSIAATRVPAIYRSVAGSSDRRRLERLHQRPIEAAGEGADDLLPARQGRQPRLQVRLRGDLTTGTGSASTAIPDRTASRIRRSDVANRRPHPLRRHRHAGGFRHRLGHVGANVDQHYSGFCSRIAGRRTTA